MTLRRRPALLVARSAACLLACGLLAWSCGYTASGPVAYLIGLVRRKGDGGGATSTEAPAAEPTAATP